MLILLDLGKHKTVRVYRRKGNLNYRTSEIYLIYSEMPRLRSQNLHSSRNPEQQNLSLKVELENTHVYRTLTTDVYQTLTSLILSQTCSYTKLARFGHKKGTISKKWHKLCSGENRIIRAINKLGTKQPLLILLTTANHFFGATITCILLIYICTWQQHFSNGLNLHMPKRNLKHFR